MVNEKIPVNIISGFLGSGKTTAIIKLLHEKTSDEKWAVIINEFGKISIDSQTLQTSSEAGNVFEISGGCICCSAKGYFRENLEEILKTGIYSRIIIEPSGLGGVDMVSEIVNANADLKLMPVVCLVDMAGIENVRLQQLPIYRTQIRKADLIVLTKRDLLTDRAMEERVVANFKSMYPDKETVLKPEKNGFWFSLIDLGDPAAKEEIKFRMILTDEKQLKDDNYQVSSHIFKTDITFSTNRLLQYFNKNQSIIRAKGHLLTEKGWVLLNFTLSGCTFEPCEAKNQSELVIITERLKPDQTNTFNEEIMASAILEK